MKHIETYHRDLVTWRVTGVTDAGTAITVPSDVPYIKGCYLHKEGDVTGYTLLGTYSHAASAAAIWTFDGWTVDAAKVAKYAGDTICTVASPTGETTNWSIVAWR